MRDRVRIESDAGEFDRFTSFEVSSDLSGPSEASFEVGDDGTWDSLEKFIAHGTKYRVFVNGAPRLTGRVQLVDVPTDSRGGSAVRFIVRSKLADAAFASASPKTQIYGASLKQFLLDVYKTIGVVEKDFVFNADLARNLMTGESRTTGKKPADLEPIQEQQAKVNPPETVFQAADKHLKRFGFMHWDAPDGRIVVGAPNDSQDPTYFFRMMLGPNGAQNNLLSANRVQDWSDLSNLIGVFGVGGKWDYSQAAARGFAFDKDMDKAGFLRPVVIVSEGIQTPALAARAAKRELSNRSRRKDAWELTTDGLSWWDGAKTIPFGIDTVCEVNSSVAGGPAGAYYVHRVVSTRNPSEADKTVLSAVRRGVWVL